MLRRVTGKRFVHFGGSGRGAGWAGLIEVDAEDEAPLAEALAHAQPVRLAHGGKELVFGPYYARAAAFVPVIERRRRRLRLRATMSSRRRPTTR